MTDTLSAISAKLLLICAICFIVIGVLLYAPTVSASNAPLNQPEYLLGGAEDKVHWICNNKGLDETKVTYFYYDYWSSLYGSTVTTEVCVFDVSELSSPDDLRFTVDQINYIPNNSDAWSFSISSSNCPFYYSNYYSSYTVNSSQRTNYQPYQYSSNGTFFSTNTARNSWTRPLPCTPLFDPSNVTYNDNYITFVYTPEIDTDEQTYADVLLQGYLHENNIDVDKATAWIILYSGEPIQIPISYSEPTNYNGDFYVKQTSATPYLDKFSVVATNPDYDFSMYRGSRVCIKYPFNATTLKLYGLYADTPSDHEPNIAFDPTLPQGSNYVLNQLNGVPGLYDFSGRTYYGRLLTMSDTVNVDYPVFISWDMWLNPLSAIPHTHSLLVGIDLTVTDENGDSTIGRDTTNYNNYVTNYNNEVIAGLTGTISGRTRFEADWRGQDVSTHIDYDNDWTFDEDANVTNMFTSFFTMGDEFLTKAVLGVLSIAFASYLLFGKH